MLIYDLFRAKVSVYPAVKSIMINSLIRLVLLKKTFTLTIYLNLDSGNVQQLITGLHATGAIGRKVR